jgi:hypothetical protein
MRVPPRSRLSSRRNVLIKDSKGVQVGDHGYQVNTFNN